MNVQSWNFRWNINAGDGFRINLLVCVLLISIFFLVYFSFPCLISFKMFTLNFHFLLICHTIRRKKTFNYFKTETIAPFTSMWGRANKITFQKVIKLMNKFRNRVQIVSWYCLDFICMFTGLRHFLSSCIDLCEQWK